MRHFHFFATEHPPSHSSLLLSPIYWRDTCTLFISSKIIIEFHLLARSDVIIIEFYVAIQSDASNPAPFLRTFQMERRLQRNEDLDRRWKKSVTSDKTIILTTQPALEKQTSQHEETASIGSAGLRFRKSC